MGLLFSGGFVDYIVLVLRARCDACGNTAVGEIPVRLIGRWEFEFPARCPHCDGPSRLTGLDIIVDPNLSAEPETDGYMNQMVERMRGTENPTEPRRGLPSRFNVGSITMSYDQLLLASLGISFNEGEE